MRQRGAQAPDTKATNGGTIRRAARSSNAAKRWPKEAIRDAIETLESAYGFPDHSPRYEPMDELISCILTQHTSDANAYPAFERMKRQYPTWEQVVEAGPVAIADSVRAAGLANQKAKNIILCLEAIFERNGAYDLENLRAMPTLMARDWLMALPGVGPKTASIVLCFAFGRETIPVDTHVYRVSMRLGMIPESSDEAKAHDLLLSLVPAELAFRFHVALIRHGRQVCKAPIPRCAECLVSARCPWLQKVGPERKLAEMRKARTLRRKDPAKLK